MKTPHTGRDTTIAMMDMMVVAATSSKPHSLINRLLGIDPQWHAFSLFMDRMVEDGRLDVIEQCLKLSNFSRDETGKRTTCLYTLIFYADVYSQPAIGRLLHRHLDEKERSILATIFESSTARPSAALIDDTSAFFSRGQPSDRSTRELRGMQDGWIRTY